MEQKRYKAEELLALESWDFYNEGNNNIIMNYCGEHPFLKKKVLRIRKATNKQFYTDPLLMEEQEYYSLFLGVLQSEPVMSRFVPEIEQIAAPSLEFLKKVEAKVKEKREERRLKAENSGIDFETPQVLLVTSFVCQQEELTTSRILTFETKPKSGVREFLPSTVKHSLSLSGESSPFSKALQLVQSQGSLENKEESKENGYSIQEQFVRENISKFQVMQTSRFHLGKLKKLATYCPFDFFETFGRQNTLLKSLNDLIVDQQIYGKLFVNGVVQKQAEGKTLEMVAQFLRNSNIIFAIYKFQSFSTLSLECVALLYSLVLPKLSSPDTQASQFALIRKIMSSFCLDKMKEEANLLANLDPEALKEQAKSMEEEQIWKAILGYLVSATAKDFTIIMRIIEASPSDLLPSNLLRNELVEEFEGKAYVVRIGVIDLEGKLYTKIPQYIKEVEEAYLNFVAHHSQ